VLGQSEVDQLDLQLLALVFGGTGTFFGFFLVVNKDDILRLQVPMRYILIMQVFNG
jgi:hypothetical protein